MFEDILKQLSLLNPIVHCITNYVTANDCANAILAVNGSAIMADDINEVSEITTLCNSLVINIGTLNNHKIDAMIKAGKMANHLNHPIIFDPVGVGASKFRSEAAKKLLQEIKFSVIRGNISEIKALVKNINGTRGVDANDGDAITSANLDEIIKFARAFSKQTGAVIAITGTIDLVVDESKAFVIYNGCKTMAKITGTGCMLSAILGAFVAAKPGNILETAAYAIATMGYCGEIADQKMRNEESGTGSFKVHLIDALSTLNYNDLKQVLKLKFAKEQLELYLVTDSNLVAKENFEAAIEQAIQGGVTMVQLREKNLSFQDFVAKAKKIKQICHQYNVPLIINDNLDVALAIDSDGIHIGQNDLPATLVRQKIGPDKILGVSTHNLDEALKAKQDGANYLGAGAMFSTATKQDATNLPISKLQEITTNIDLPVVAIGGINEDNCLQLKNCHLAGIAVVSAIMAKKDIKKAAKELKNKAKDLYD